MAHSVCRRHIPNRQDTLHRTGHSGGRSQGGGQSHPLSNSPIVLSFSPLPHHCMILSLNHHSSDPIASLTSRSICCSHHQQCGTAPLFCLPCLHSIRTGQVAGYTTIVCRQIGWLTPIPGSAEGFTNAMQVKSSNNAQAGFPQSIMLQQHIFIQSSCLRELIMSFVFTMGWVYSGWKWEILDMQKRYRKSHNKRRW